MAQDPGEPIDTVVRIDKSCPCTEAWCMSREMVDTMNTIVDSEHACREDLLECRKERIEMVAPTTGWSPGMVLLVGGVIVLTVLATGFGVGYYVGNR
jgi:hypothetical protein